MGCEFVNFPTKRTERRRATILYLIEEVSGVNVSSLYLFGIVREQINVISSTFRMTCNKSGGVKSIHSHSC